ncbi:MAG TPA: PadR family transcriptional regulator [Firmicutes bacterium]|nr:PadR family transcriptional regulator [Bacillota bacterium]
MISSDVMRGYHDLMILWVLVQQDSYGYEISKLIFEHTGGTYTMKETTLYSAFNRLEKQGYIFSYPGLETHGKRRTYYQMTEAGREYYIDKCKEWHLTKQLMNQFVKGDEWNE